jgi:hypothetical protein
MSDVKTTVDVRVGDRCKVFRVLLPKLDGRDGVQGNVVDRGLVGLEDALLGPFLLIFLLYGYEGVALLGACLDTLEDEPLWLSMFSLSVPFRSFKGVATCRPSIGLTGAAMMGPATSNSAREPCRGYEESNLVSCYTWFSRPMD